MSYFTDTYEELRYPIGSEESPGLRNAQLGAIHAIASFQTLHKKSAGIVVMPTGSGKTAVLMMTPYITQAVKVLIVTPSTMVRGQIFEEFAGLITLRKSRVFEDTVTTPVVYELKCLYAEELQANIENADVIVASPQCALSLSESTINEQFDLVLIDEAHHVPAVTWQQILLNMKFANRILFTATPFRMDRKDISGEIIYTYPLSMAYRDGIFGEIQYIPIEAAPEKDKLIAKEAERILLNDRQKGLEHYLMVRTDTKENAKRLEDLYGEETSLHLKRIDSSMSYRTIKLCIKELKEKKIDGIICVDMLGEGFDFPNLKIAAVHAPHKSLASALQFIGRFARTNAENIGVAKFIAMNDDELVIENYKLYVSDAIWQEIIIDMSERKIHREEAIKKNIEKYVRSDGTPIDDEAISLHALRPNCHAKIFYISGFNINSSFPDMYRIDNVYRNLGDNTVIGICAHRERPIWSETDQVLDIQNLLYIVHYQTETSLLFIYSQLKNDADYESIAKAFTTDFEKVPRNEIHRVLGELHEFEMFNTGMQNRFAENGESYRIYAGSNVADSIDPVTGKMYAAGHVFCKAISAETPITIGYSSGSKIWSSSYLTIPEYVQWCNDNGTKIANSRMIVRTNTNYDYMPMPRRLEAFPTEIFFCFFSDRTYTSPPVLMRNTDSTNVILTDASIYIDLEKIADDRKSIDVVISLEEYTDRITYNTDGSYLCDKPTILLKDGKNRITLVDYLNNNPLLFKTTNDSTIEGFEICTGAPDAVVYSTDNISSLDWNKYNTDISLEFGEDRNGKKAIQTVMHDMLVEKDSFDYLIYDHGSGEIADYITIKENDQSLETVLYHAKAMKGISFNSDVGDIYEVTQQAVKSIIWLKSGGWLLEKIKSRRKGGHCIFQKGEFNELEKAFKQNKRFTAKIVVVQPAVNKNIIMPAKYQEILASASFYIKNSGRATKLEIWGS